MIKLLIAATFVCVNLACLITNCPRGGKRGETPLLAMSSLVKECPNCGPGHQGQCFGPNICCGTTFGCYINTPETYKCRGESLYSRPCIAGFAMCRDNTARCASNGICCSQDNCQIDSTCGVGEEYATERKIGQEFARLTAETEQ